MPLPNLVRRRPAVALLLVLVMLAMLAAVTAQIVASAMHQITWETQRSQDDVLRSNAFSGLETSLAILAAFRQADGALYGPAQGWGDPLTVAGFSGSDGVEVSVQIGDESGKYGVSAMNTQALRSYFEDLGFGMGQASSLADCLLDWTDADDNPRANGAERDAYGDNVVPPNRPLKSFAEVRLIRGFKEAFGLSENASEDEIPADAWRLFKGSASLLGNSARPNINTATPETLEVLALRGGFDAQSVIAMRGESTADGSSIGNGRIFRNAGDLALNSIPSSLAAKITFTCTRLRIVTRASKGDSAFIIDTLVDVGGSGNFPFTIVQQRVNAMLQQ